MRLDELGQTFVWLFVSSVKTGTRRIIRPDELSSVVRLTTFVRVFFTLATKNQMNVFPSSSRRIMRSLVLCIKTANHYS